MPNWSRTEQALCRTVKFPSFPDAVAFITRLGFYAESVNHHPDIQISYRTVTIKWTTHDAGGVTPKDKAGAKATDALLPKK